jgi:DNA-binding NarL/FixJ family response regulator
MSRLRVLLADDHKIILHGLQSILEPEFEIVAMVEDGRELIRKARELQPDVIVTDIAMPFFNGIEAVRELKKSDKSVKVIFLTMQSDVTYAAKAFEAGAVGYVLKHSAPSELVTAIREILKGRTYVTPRIAGQLMDLYKIGAPAAKARDKSESVSLTERQREILCFLADGLSAKEIATKLNLSTRTVEAHKYRMMQALNFKNTAELVAYAVKVGITTNSLQHDEVIGKSKPAE